MKTYYAISSINDLYLAHHGILGQKWGVRRYQNPDGSLTPEGRVRYGRDVNEHTINKNTPLYRTSAFVENEPTKHLYVTYTKPDRSLYKGEYSKVLAMNQTGNPNSKMYESEYRLKKDLKIPSKETVNEVIQNLAKDKMSRLYTSKAQSNTWWNEESIYNEAADSYVENLLSKNKTSDDWNDEEYRHFVQQEGNKWIKDHAEQLKTMHTDDIFIETAQSFGTQSYNRDKVISELQKMGYDAMVDEAGVGRKDVPEGVEPLIIFDKNSTVEKIRSEPISTSESIKATKEYLKWKSNTRKQLGLS